jgi:hypothetical protein
MTLKEFSIMLEKPELPPFRFTVWIFLYTLINRKEGKRLVEKLIEKMEKSIQKSDEMILKVDAYAKQAEERYRQSKAAAANSPVSGSNA